MILVHGEGGEVSVVGACGACGAPTRGHPNKVPSAEGRLICRSCFGLMNEARERRGVAPLQLLEGAYEPAPSEADVNWKGRPQPFPGR